VIDLTNKRYFFELTTRPNVIWVDLSNFDLKPGAPVMILNPDNMSLSGEVAGESRKGTILTGSWANT
jgi:penicillin V acylase-like amidase (Ntn superfamily)